MANIRIKDLSTTAASTASDDFIAVDGSANGTRKLNAYSPTFGGNLTVSGTSALNGTVNTNGSKAVNVTPTMTPLSGNLYGLYVYPTINSGASAGGTVSGLTVAATNSGTSNVTNIAGIEFIGGNGAASGSMQDLKAFRSSPVNLSTGQIVNLYQFYATNAYNPSGTINTQYGLYVDALTSATTNYAIYTAGTAPSVLGGNLTVSGTQIQMGGVNPFIQGTTGAGYIQFQNAGDVVVASNTGKLVLIANGSTQATVATTGNFLLGTTTDVGPRLLSKAKDNTYAGAGIGIVDQSAGTSYITRANGTFYISNNGSTDHFALDASGNATFAGSIRQNQANNISLTSGVATTIFSLGTSAGVYIVTATLDVNAVAGYAIVGKGATGSWQVLANSGTQMSFSMSTNDLQITQSSGSTSTTNTFNLLRLR